LKQLSIKPIKGQSHPVSVQRHPPGDGASQWIQHDAEQPDKHPPGSAWSGSDASFRVGLAIRYWWSFHHPHNSKPNPANAAALLKQEEAATSAAGALDADPSGSEIFLNLSFCHQFEVEVIAYIEIFASSCTCMHLGILLEVNIARSQKRLVL
jgi:hypothetical protein